jgi:AcrR family transcriptional regulator
MKNIEGILQTAFNVFVENGFDDTTFQKIADRAGITRTTLYQYFRNKLDIFNYSIQVFLKDVEKELTAIYKNPTITAPDKLSAFLDIIFDKLETNKRLVAVLLDFLVNIHDNPVELRYHLRRRTIRFRHFISGILIDGITAGQIKRVDIKAANNVFFSMIEAAVFEMSVFKQDDIARLLTSYKAIIAALAL